MGGLTTTYTCRVVSDAPLKIEVIKWEGGVRPSNIYTVYPGTNSCDCVATKRECKHVQLAKDIADPEFINESFKWQWNEKNGWHEAFDIPQPKEFASAVFAS